MKGTAYKYSNTGLFPVRYIARRSYPKEVISAKEGFSDDYILQKNENRKKSLENLNKGFETKGVSSVTRKKIITACRVMSYSSEVQTVRTTRGTYEKHLLMFITLSLPSEQKHEDTEITKIVLGDFLDRCRKLGFMSNYVWKAEKQKNGNIHYHLLTDSFVSFSLIRRLWYISLKKLGYMQAYHDKFSKMPFDEYRSQPFNKNVDLHKITARFARGVRNKWSEPPCVDTDKADSIEGVSFYISKYVGKQSDDNENFVKGRVWGCSQSVSNAVKVFKGDQEFNSFWYNYGTQILKRKEFISDFFSICKCSFNSIISWCRDVEIYIKNLLSKVYTPCDYWRYSLGLFAT